MLLRDRIEQSVEYLQRKLGGYSPQVAMILGSGLGEYADALINRIEIPYEEIPGFPISTVEGHKGQFVVGERKGITVLAMQGRFHYYEGYSQQEITLPVRVMKRLGIETLFITNAAGGVNLSFAEGALMVITDHINFSFGNPLVGENLAEYGPRFPDLTTVYTPNLREKVIDKALDHGIQLDQGVYVMFSGPNYETPAEVRLARFMGADAVGMSTVPEAIVAAHSGMRVLGLSCITNMAAGVLETPLNHDDVVNVAARVRVNFIQVLDLSLEVVGEEK